MDRLKKKKKNDSQTLNRDLAMFSETPPNKLLRNA